MAKGNTGNYSGPYSKVKPVADKRRNSRADGRKPTSNNSPKVVGQVDGNSDLSGAIRIPTRGAK
jgi:hypothetical protein